MKNTNIKQALGSLTLIAALSSAPGMALADASTTAAVKEMHADIGTKIDNTNSYVQSAKDSLSEIRQIVDDHYKLDDADDSRKEAATAIINYMAEEAQARYEREKALLFQNAPGVNWAIDAGGNVGSMNLEAVVEGLAEFSFQQTMGSVMPSDDQIQAAGLEQAMEAAGLGSDSGLNMKSIIFRDLISAQLEQGSSVNFSDLDASKSIRSDRTTSEDAQEYLKLVVGSDLEIDTAIAKKIKNGEQLTVGEQEVVAATLLQAVNLGPSTTIFSSMLGRRIADDENQKSVMEIIGKYANDRFQNEAWYTEVGKSSDTALLREMVHMMAYNMWLQHQAFKTQEQAAATLAIMNSNFAKMYNALKDMNEKLEDQAEEARKAAAEAEEELDNIDVDVE